jgi:uncharacterized protein (DUF58 family)
MLEDKFKNEYLNYLKPDVISRLGNMELRARLVVEGFITGLHRSPYHGFSVEFAEHRQYMPGDEIKHVDWKVYGKTNRFYIKQFEEETNLKAYILLDSSASMGYKSGKISKFEYGAYLSAALSYLMIKQRDAVGLLTFDEKIRTYLPPRSIKSYLFQILQQLELTRPGAQTKISLILHEMAERIKRRGLIILISDLFDEPAAVLSGLKHFRHRNHDVILFHLLDPMERTFNFKKDAIFVDLETDEEIPTQPWHILRDYQDKMDDFIKNYKNGCLENNIEYVLLDTSMPFDKALFQYLVKRKRIGG